MQDLQNKFGIIGLDFWHDVLLQKNLRYFAVTWLSPELILAFFVKCRSAGSLICSEVESQTPVITVDTLCIYEHQEDWL